MELIMLMIPFFFISNDQSMVFKYFISGKSEQVIFKLWQRKLKTEIIVLLAVHSRFFYVKSEQACYVSALKSNLWYVIQWLFLFEN